MGEAYLRRYGILVTGECPEGGEHDYESIGGESANCSHGNITYYKCRKCEGLDEIDDGNKTGEHSYYPEIVSFDCEDGGTYYEICSGCGAKRGPYAIEGGGEHSFTGILDQKAADCANDGYITKKCSNCPATDTTSIPATGDHAPDPHSPWRCIHCGQQMPNT